MGSEICYESAREGQLVSNFHTVLVRSESEHDDIYSQLEIYFHKEFNEDKHDEDVAASVEDNKTGR